VKFAKTCSRAFEIQHPEEQESTALAEHRRISRQLIPFVTSPAPDKTLSGVFLTGENPSWIVQTDRASVKVIPSGHAVVHAFTATSLWDWKGDFLLYSDEVRVA
jgi:cleavage and polyadenylation specificity factor subunit 1